jgi:RNA polymerase sigma-70 factor, ECF subfamily
MTTMSHTTPAPARLDLASVYLEDREFMLRALARIGVNRREREDVASEVWVRVAQLMGRLDPARGASRAWLYTVALMTTRTHWRKSGTERRKMEALAAGSVPTGEAVSAEDREHLRAAVAQALVQLPATEREALELHYGRGCTQAAIAAATGVREGTVSSRCHRARLAATIQSPPAESMCVLRAVVLRALADLQMSQSELAMATGICATDLSKMLSGNVGLTWKQTTRMFNALGCLDAVSRAIADAVAKHARRPEKIGGLVNDAH